MKAVLSWIENFAHQYPIWTIAICALGINFLVQTFLEYDRKFRL